LHGIAPANSISTSCDAGFDWNSAVNTAIAGKEAGKDMNKTTITPQEYAELKRLAQEYATVLEKAPILVVDDDNAVRDVVVQNTVRKWLRSADGKRRFRGPSHSRPTFS
jgi:hypothetical protein